MAKNPNILTRFWQELKRRKVFKVVAMYAGTAFIIIQLVDTLTDPLHLPPWVETLVVILLSAGFPLVAILAWIFDLTPEGIKKTGSIEGLAGKEIVAAPTRRRLRASDIVIVAMAIVIIILAWPKIFRKDAIERLRSSGEKLSVAVMPFQNMTNDTTWNPWQVGIQQRLISSLSNTMELQVRHKELIQNLLQNQGLAEFASISPDIAGIVSKKLEADIFIYGSIQQAGNEVSLDAQLIDTKSKDVIKSFEVSGHSTDEMMFPLTDSLRKKVTDFLLISKLIKEYPIYQAAPLTTRSPEALRYCIYGDKASYNFDGSTARTWYLKALAIDSNYFDAFVGLFSSGTMDQNLQGLLNLYKK